MKISTKSISRLRDVYAYLENGPKTFENIKENLKGINIQCLHEMNKLTTRKEYKIFRKTKNNSLKDRLYYISEEFKGMPMMVFNEAVKESLENEDMLRPDYVRTIPNFKRKKNDIVNKSKKN